MPDPLPARPLHLGGAERYEIGVELGRGGMGTVYRAWDFDLDRAVAMKVLNHFIEDDERFAARFIQEAQLAARLQHPAIVPVYDVGTNAAGKLYFTMRLVEGRTLGAVVKLARGGDAALAREYTRFRLVETFREICLAMAYVHEHGIVHRDLKPDNIMLGAYGEVEVMDWGIAKALSAAAKPSSGAPAVRLDPESPPAELSPRYGGQTAAGEVMGTPAFMAPEQARGESEVTPLWDIYALGGILHYLLSGRVPAPAATRRGEAGQDATALLPVRQSDPTVPRELEAICMRALARAPSNRYPTAKALADDVQAFLEQRPVSALPEGPLRRAWKWARRRRRALAGVAAAMVVVVTAVGISRIVSARAALEQARAEAASAGEAFRAAREELGAVAQDPNALRTARNKVLGLGMTALQAAQAANALAPRDPSASSVAFDAALSLGEVAEDDQQWGLAASAFERAKDAHVDDARASRALEDLEKARTRADDERKKTVAAIVSGARAGALLRDADYQDALFTLVGLGERATSEMLASELVSVTSEVREAVRAFLLSANTLTDEELRKGEAPIDGLEVLVDVSLAKPPGQHRPITDETRRTIGRLVSRAAGGVPAGSPLPTFRALAGAEEERRVGAGPLRLAQLASEALGRMAGTDAAVDALEHYLAIEEDELRAIPAAQALCRIGRPTSEKVIVAVRGRLGSVSGVFWRQVGPDVKRFRAAEGPDPTTVEGLLTRSRTRSAKGDSEGALADASRVIELEPNATAGWIARGIIRRKDGDLDGAIADYSHAIALDPGSAVPWNDRGFAELERGDLDLAIADFDHSLELRPRSARTLTHRATAYRLKGNLRAAIAGCDDAVNIDRRFALAYRERGAAHASAKEAALAVTDYDRAIELDGSDPEAWAGRAMARLLAEGTDAALADANRAIELDPQSGPARIARAEVRRARGDAAGALADAKYALTLELHPREDVAARALFVALTRGAKRE